MVKILLTRYSSSDQIREKGMDGACSMHEERRGEVHARVWWENLSERETAWKMLAKMGGK